jgi:hypothetical protein
MVVPMKIELKNIRHNERLSRGTFCFSADLIIDGKKAGDVSNSGDGGCSRYEPRSLEQLLDAHAQTLPPKMISGLSLQPNGDQVVFDLVADWLMEKDLKRLMRTRIVYLRAGRIEITKPFAADVMGQVLAPNYRPRLQEKLKSEHILNGMPFPEARAAYIEAVSAEAA